MPAGGVAPGPVGVPDLEHLAAEQIRMAARAITEHRFRANGTRGVLIQACPTRKIGAIMVGSSCTGMPWIVGTADVLAPATLRTTFAHRS